MVLFSIGLFSSLKKPGNQNNHENVQDEYGPKVSIIIPVKNGERVLPRLLDSLLEVDYPRGNMEILLVEDGSVDRSYELCLSYASKHPELIKVFHRKTSKGKPDALVYAIKHASGRIFAFFDVDSVINRDVIKLAIKSLKDPGIAAVQGRTASLNADKNFITRLVSLEELCYSIILEGRNSLGLFVPLTGSCMFIKREALECVGGWNIESLTEDMDLSIRFLKNGLRIIYNWNVRSYQETPHFLGALFKQRRRWYRGLIETSFESIKLFKSLNLKLIDAFSISIAPIILLLSQIFYFSLTTVVLLGYNFPLLEIILQLSLIFMTMFISFVIITFYVFMKRNAKKSLILGPLMLIYWAFLGLVALVSMVDVITGSKRRWITTPKVGQI